MQELESPTNCGSVLLLGFNHGNSTVVLYGDSLVGLLCCMSAAVMKVLFIAYGLRSFIFDSQRIH